MRILIAEDDAVSRTLLRSLLERFGFDVLMASGGEEAWRLFQQQRPKLVITDWLMPEVDGLELCRRIRDDRTGGHRYTYLVVLTAQSGKRQYLEGMNAGADDFMVKPFDPDELLARLRVAERVLALEAEIGRLETLVSCCPDCRQVRDDGGRWQPLARAAAAQVARGRLLCPDCVRTRADRRADGIARSA